MKLHHDTATVFVPNGSPEAQALSRTTHLGIGAHQDDLEFMAFHGILSCYQKEREWFTGVTCTNGAGSARAGRFASCSDEQMQDIRREEQNQAARIGQYSAMIQLDHGSSGIKTPRATAFLDDLIVVLLATQPRVVYTHNLADKHETHIGVAVAAIEAMRSLPREQRPVAVYGCEVWRDLDWMPDDEKIAHDVSGFDHLASALNGIFDSQIGGGKRYDLGVIGRRRANATFSESHATDRSDSIALAMNLTPLVNDPSLDIISYTEGFIDRFRDNVRETLKRRLGR